MCGGSSVGVTQDGGRAVSSTGSTAAHELGHEFNMGHDAGKCLGIATRLEEDTTDFFVCI